MTELVVCVQKGNVDVVAEPHEDVVRPGLHLPYIPDDKVLGVEQEVAIADMDPVEFSLAQEVCRGDLNRAATAYAARIHAAKERRHVI